MKHEWRRVKLGERDYEILAGIEKWGILGLAQLEGLVFKKGAVWDDRIRLFFNEAGREIYTKACYKRLSDLEAAGYVRPQFYLNHRKLYTLTQGGHEALIAAGKAKLHGYRRGMSEALITHEIKVNGVGFMLSELLGFTVATERQLEWHYYEGKKEKGRQQLPDLWIVDEERPRAVEVELIQKSEHRYKEIFYRYSNMIEYGGAVLYLSGWPKGAEFLWTLAKKWDRPFIYVASLEQFRATQGRCRFVAIRDELHLAPELPVAPIAVPTPEPKPVEAVAVSTPAGVQEAPPKASLDAPEEEPAQWGGGPRINPYAHLPPYQRPEEYRY